jgi:hypothetical protein
MRISDSGVGIGLSSGIGAALHVDPSTNVTLDFGTPLIKVGGDNSWAGNGSIYSIGFGYHSASMANARSPAEIGLVTTASSGSTKGALVFATRDSDSGTTAPTERARITSAGDWLVGKNASGTAQGFEVQQDGEVYSVIVNGLNTYHVYANSGYRFYVKPDGGIVNYSSNNVNLSDEREKKNIEALESQWDSLKQWSLKKFHYNADADSDNKTLGVIAQEVEAHNPEVIDEFNVDEDTTRMAIKEQQMMWMAIKALQEAQTRIESLEARLSALEA